MKVRRLPAGRSVAILATSTALVFAVGSGAYSSASQRQPVPAAITQRALHLLNGWTSADSGNGTGKPRYAVSGGVVYLSGSLTQPTSNVNDIFARLPKGARPAHILYMAIYVSQGAGGTVQILPGGQLAVFSNAHGAAAAFSSLAGISFPVSS